MSLAAVGTIDSGAFAANTSVNVTCTGTTVGNGFMCGIAQQNSNDRTYGIADGANTFTQRQRCKTAGSPTDWIAEVWTAPITTGGDRTVNFTANANATAQLGVREISGSPTYETSDQLEEVADSTSHACSLLGVNTSADCYVFCVGVLTANGGTTVAGGSYTKVGPVAGQMIFQERFSAGALTADTGPWTNSGSARHGPMVMATFKGPAAAAGLGMPFDAGSAFDGGKCFAGIMR